MKDKRNPTQQNQRNRSKYLITSGPWKGTTVTPLANTDRPGIILAKDREGRYIQIDAANLAPIRAKAKARNVAQPENQ